MRGFAVVVLSVGVFALVAPGVGVTGRSVTSRSRTVLFTSGDPFADTGGPFLIDAGGANLRRPSLPDGAISPTWSPDGRTLAYGEYVDASHLDQRLVVVTVGAGTRTYPLGYTSVFGLSWSPDSAMLLYGEDGYAWHLLTVAAGTTRELPGSVSESAAKWSPDGRRIAYVAGRTPATAGLVTIGVHGTRPRPVGTARATSFDWAPDGKRLVYSNTAGLFTIGVDGRDRRTLLRRYLLDPPEVSWSPTGQWIAIDGELGPTPVGAVDPLELLPPALYVIRPDGHGLRKLAAALTPSGGLGAHPWTPDGRTIIEAAVEAGSGWDDVWSVSVPTGTSRRITNNQYGPRLWQPEWLPARIAPALLQTTPASLALPNDVVIEGGVLESPHSIESIAADGSLAAIAEGPFKLGSTAAFEPGCLDLWDSRAGSIARVDPGRSCVPPSPTNCCGLSASGFIGPAVAGTWVAWTSFWHFAGLDLFDVLAGTAPLNVTPSVCSATPDCVEPVADLVGQGDLIVFDTWTESCPTPSFPTACALAPKTQGALWRLDGGTATRIATSSGGLTPLAVDADRILVDRGDGTLDLLRPDGSSIRTFTYQPNDFVGATLQGNDLVVQRRAAIDDVDATTGTVLHTHQLQIGAVLQGAQNGIVAYLAGDEVHLLRLSDGADAAFAPAGHDPHAALTTAGLFYAYTTDDPDYPGRVVFVPSDRLPLR